MSDKKRDELGDEPAPKFNYYRASGLTLCETCGEKYFDHPVIRRAEKLRFMCELFVLCNNDRVKC